MHCSAHSDIFLYSALGVYDGKVYEALWERAQSEPLNRKEVPDGYEVRFRHSHTLWYRTLIICLGVYQTGVAPWATAGLYS